MKKLFLFLVMLLWAGGAWATYPSYTVCPSGCDYNTLNGAVADLEANHATPASPVTITISGSWSSPDTTAVSISGLTTTSTNTLTITTTGSARHNGTWSSTGYRLIYSTAISNTTPIFITSNQGYIIIDGLQIQMTNVGYSGIACIKQDDSGFSGNYLTIKNNILVGVDSGGIAGGIIINNNGTGGFSIINYIYNNVIYGGSGNGISIVDESNIVNDIYNNTIYGTATGFNISSQETLINNIANNNLTDYSGTPGTHSNNISQDTSSPDSVYRSKTVSFVNTGSYNFNLATNDTSATGQGANESGVFTTDITGATRTVPWDIGAFKATAIIISPHTELFSNGNLYSKGNLYVQ